MPQNQPTRFQEKFDGEVVSEGDRIHPQLVAADVDQLGEPLDPTKDLPETKLLLLTTLNKYDDVHSALLLDTETQLIIRAERHSRQAALLEKEYDWKVRGVGRAIEVREATVEYRPDEDGDIEEDEYMQQWVTSLVDAVTIFEDYDLSSNWYLDGSSMTILDTERERKGRVEIRLTGEI